MLEAMSLLASPLSRPLCWLSLLGLAACSSSAPPPAQHPVPSTAAPPTEEPSEETQEAKAAQIERASRIKITTSLAHGLRMAATLVLQTNPSRCPTADEVVATKLVSPHLSVADAWDRRFEIICNDELVIVRSAGPDGVLGTADDISTEAQ